VTRILILLALAGCAADGGGDLPPEVILGTGLDAFVPLADGDDVTIVQGPQGGFHVYGSVRAAGLFPGNPDDLYADCNPTTEFRAYQGDVRVDLGASTYRQGLDPGPEPYYQMIGRLVILDIDSPAQLDGVSLRLEVTILDHDGLSAADQRLVVARAP
jgi:hypothetical protein